MTRQEIFIAEDGKRFDHASDCIDYEKELHRKMYETSNEEKLEKICQLLTYFNIPCEFLPNDGDTIFCSSPMLILKDPNNNSRQLQMICSTEKKNSCFIWRVKGKDEIE